MVVLFRLEAIPVCYRTAVQKLVCHYIGLANNSRNAHAGLYFFYILLSCLKGDLTDVDPNTDWYSKGKEIYEQLEMLCRKHAQPQMTFCVTYR